MPVARPERPPQRCPSPWRLPPPSVVSAGSRSSGWPRRGRSSEDATGGSGRRGLGWAEQVSLPDRHPELGQRERLAPSLDALRDERDAELLGEPGQGAGEGAAGRVRLDGGDDAAVELDDLGPEGQQPLQTGEA